MVKKVYKKSLAAILFSSLPGILIQDESAKVMKVNDEEEIEEEDRDGGNS